MNAPSRARRAEVCTLDNTIQQNLEALDYG